MNLAALLAQYAGQPDPTPPPSLTDRLGLGRTVVAPEHVIVAPSTLNEKLAASRRGPEHTDELLRIKELPRRPRPEDGGDYFKSLQAKWDAKLRIDSDVAPCDCAQRYGFCIKHLTDIQAWALEEFAAGEADDLAIVGKIGVGSGKTGLDVLLGMVRPGVRNVLLLLKANLVDQFIEVDFPQWSVHFRTPNLDSRYSSTFRPDRPTLHVYSYEEISSRKNSGKIKQIAPDLIIADEAQKLGNVKTSRTTRFMTYLRENPSTLYVPLSGSLNGKGISDNGHQYGMALGQRSPLPLNPETQKRWGKVLDQKEDEYSGRGVASIPIGALEVFCKPGEDVVEGVGRWVNETPGVISSVELSCRLPLKLVTRHPLAIPPALAEAMSGTRATGARPDGEEAETSFQKALWLREMACGFYYRNRFPRGEPEELILKWMAAKKAWYKEVRAFLDGSAPENLDSPTLLANAAERWCRGYKGKLPVYESVNYPAWRLIKDKVQPEQSIVWLDDHLLNDAVAWAEERKAAGEGGIIWCEFTEIGRRIAKRLGVDYFNGQDWSPALRAETGDRVVVCSIKGFGTGHNLQRFRRHLVTSNPASAEIWQQLLGRPHRKGQTGAVQFDVYRHTQELRNALETAIDRADWIQRFDKEEQKLCFATRDW